MDNTGEQLHPNWRALATVHIPLKRFIKEGYQEQQKATRDNTNKKYQISDVSGEDIKEFYEELINKEQHSVIIKDAAHKRNDTLKQCLQKQQTVTKTPFEVKKYFRFAMENNVKELKNLNLKDQDFNVCDSYGWSALMMASCEGAYEAVEYLLNIGVDRHIKDKSGKSAKDLAFKKGFYKVMELLEKHDSNKTKEDECRCKILEKDEPFYCEICKHNFKETSQGQHETSTVHQFNMKSTLPANKLQKFNIAPRNKGLQLMVKQGWDKESGLGPSQSGRLYPIKTVLRKTRSGLGVEQPAARVTHFEAFDRKAIKRQNSDYYKKKPRNRNDIRREKIREWKKDRRLRNELN